jgi:hypothetical protein
VPIRTIPLSSWWMDVDAHFPTWVELRTAIAASGNTSTFVLAGAAFISDYDKEIDLSG